MKNRRLVYIIIGSLMILANLATDFLTPIMQDMSAQGDVAAQSGYFFGTQFFAFIGIVLLVLAYNVTRKIKRKEKWDLQKSIDEIGIE